MISNTASLKKQAIDSNGAANRFLEGYAKHTRRRGTAMTLAALTALHLATDCSDARANQMPSAQSSNIGSVFKQDDIDEESKIKIVGLAMMFIIFSFIAIQSKKNRPFEIGKSDTKFSDVRGNPQNVALVKSLVEILNKKNNLVGAKIPKDILLTGPPGTGKTLLARAVAGEAGYNLIHTAGQDFGGIIAGRGARQIKNIFRYARKHSPCIIFIDEIESLGGKRSSNDHPISRDNDKTLTALLTEMSGFKPSDGIIVIAATNKPELLDNALTRPGRFDYTLDVGIPQTVKQVEDILDLYISRRKVAGQIENNVTAEEIAKLTLGFSPAMLEGVLESAARNALRYDRSKISLEDIYEGIDLITHGPKLEIEPSKAELERVLAHEYLGHFLMAHVLGYDVSKVSLEPRVNSMAHVAIAAPDGKQLITRSDLIKRLLLAISGKVGEKVRLGEASIGDSGDLEQVRNIMRILLTHNMLGGTTLKNYKADDRLELSAIDEAKATEFLDQAYRIAEEITLSYDEESVNAMIDYVFDRKVLIGDEAKKLASNFIAPEIIQKARKIAEDFIRSSSTG